MRNDSHKKELARCGVTHIDLCGCGMVHLGVGPVSVKLTREAFQQVVRGINLAHRALEPTPVSVAGDNVVALRPEMGQH